MYVSVGNSPSGSDTVVHTDVKPFTETSLIIISFRSSSNN
jgi:hypothetical protein